MDHSEARGLVEACAAAIDHIDSAAAALPLGGTAAADGLRALLGAPPDLIVHAIGGLDALYLGTIVDEAQVLAIMRPLAAARSGEGALPPAWAPGVTTLHTCADALRGLLGGAVVVLPPGGRGGWALPASKWPQRQIVEPPGEFIAQGPHAGLVETLGTNLGQIRQIIPDARLRLESIATGERSGTRGTLLYLQGVVRPSILDHVRGDLARAHPSFTLDSGMLSQWLAPRAGWWFPVIGRTERPDTAAAALLEGRIVILTEGSPTALLIPNVFANLLHATEDYYAPPFIADAKRALRVVGLLTAVLASPLFVALGSVNTELLPTSVFISFSQARRGVPLSLVAEVVMLEILVDVIREAGLRLPSNVGQSIAIIGAVVIGQSAVSAGLISAPAVVIVSMAFIASFTMPSTELVLALRASRFPLLLLAAVFGLLGLTLGVLLLFAYLCSLESFGVPYLAPLSPARPRGLQDMLWRVPLPSLRRSMFARRPAGAGGA